MRILTFTCFVLFSSSVYSCKTSDSSEAKSVKDEKTSFFNRESYKFFAEATDKGYMDDLIVKGNKDQTLTLAVRIQNRQVVYRDTSGYDRGITLMNFLRNLTNNFGYGLTSEQVVLDEKWATWRLYTLEHRDDLKVGDKLSAIEICVRFDPDVKKPDPSFVVLGYADVADTKKYQASKEQNKFCR